MPKYKAPAGETGINIGGQQFNANDKGIITIPDEGSYTLPQEYVQVLDVAPAAPAKPAAAKASE
jgi:hypothetical protein